MPERFRMAAALLPREAFDAAMTLPQETRARAEELRLRRGFPVSVRLPEGELPCGTPVSGALIAAVLEKATAASLHAVTAELRRGFLCAPGGIRVGVCGTAAEGTGGLRDISSLCIRIPRACRGIGGDAIARIGSDSALVVSPPGGGKTTFLRELVRRMSDCGVRVGLADERGELAGMWGGAPGFDVGRCTDVMTGAPKAEAALALLRAMSPEAVAMDEISAPEDLTAVETLLGCGVRIYATVHGTDRAALLRRPGLGALLERGAFGKLVTVSGSGERHYAVEAL